jgi:hypothetical protein
MSVAARSDGGPWIEVGTAPVDIGGRSFRAEWLAGLSDGELLVMGLERAEIIENDPPAALEVLGSDLDDVDGAPVRRWVTRSFDAEAVASMRAGLAEVVADHARRRNLAVLAGLDLALEAGTPEGDAAAAAAWAQLQAVRDAAATIVSDLPADAAGLVAFDVENHPAWP